MTIDYKKFNVGGVLVNDVDCAGLGEMLKDSIGYQEPRLVFSMNGEGVAYYNTDKKFKSIVDEADIIHADGWSTMFAGRLLSKGKFSERVATTDAYINMLQACVEKGLPVFFLGAKDTVISEAVKNISRMMPGLNVAGFHHGYISENKDEIFNLINTSGAKVIFVGLGRPLQEEFSLEIKSNCKNLIWIKTCGGLFDFISGNNKRAPEFMQKSGLEWLYRMCLEPKRLFWRYFWTNFYSVFFYIYKR